MVTGLVDTSVVIDLLRGHEPAKEWYAQQSDLGTCRIIWFEIAEGAENSQALRSALKFLQALHVVELTAPDLIWAWEKMAMLALSHGMDTFDCMIASVNQRLQIPLYTRNLKHFTPLIHDLAQRPY
jgi:tRNA(fMet)-specific endonuclease VapC